MLEEGSLNETTFILMQHFNITHVFIGCHTTVFEMYKHKWNPQPLLQNSNFNLVRKVGNAYLFAFSHKYPEVAIQDNFEYESKTEAGWKFYTHAKTDTNSYGLHIVTKENEKGMTHA